jgi:hypothetical protein
MTLIESLMNIVETRHLEITETVLTDTLEEVGVEEMTMLYDLTVSAPTAEYARLFEPMYREFFRQAMEKQRLRNMWDRSMDENDPLDMYLDEEGNVLFMEKD